MFKPFYFLLPFTIILSVFAQCKNQEKTKEVVDKKITEVTEKPITSNIQISSPPDTVPLRHVQNTLDTIREEVEKTRVVTTKGEVTESKKEAVISKKKKKRSKIKFEETIHKFGTIKSGDKVSHKFKFKNIGNAPLVIKNVDVSCGCTFPSYPFLPIKPGEEGEIDVTFNSEYKVGRQKPTVTIVTNGRPRSLKLYMEGFVE